MPYGKLNILVLWGDDKRRELDATGAVDLLDRAQLDPRPSRHRQVLHTQRMHLHPPIERLPVAPHQLGVGPVVPAHFAGYRAEPRG